MVQRDSIALAETPEHRTQVGFFLLTFPCAGSRWQRFISAPSDIQ